MRSRGWPSSNLTIVLIIRGKSGHGDIHKETTLLEDESRSRWCTCKPRNTKDCEQTTRGQEKSMEKGLPHSPQREPQEWPWTCTSSYKSGETIYFRCFEHPVFWSFVMAALANEHSTLDLKKKRSNMMKRLSMAPNWFSVSSCVRQEFTHAFSRIPGKAQAAVSGQDWDVGTCRGPMPREQGVEAKTSGGPWTLSETGECWG